MVLAADPDALARVAKQLRDVGKTADAEVVEFQRLLSLALWRKADPAPKHAAASRVYFSPVDTRLLLRKAVASALITKATPADSRRVGSAVEPRHGAGGSSSSRGPERRPAHSPPARSRDGEGAELPDELVDGGDVVGVPYRGVDVLRDVEERPGGLHVTVPRPGSRPAEILPHQEPH
jgi:hypothetical protein